MAITRIKNNQITDSTINAAAKLQDASVTGGKLANSLTYGSDFTVTGNLTVQGTTTTIDTATTTVEDPVLLLASTQTGSGAVDIGIIGERGDDTNVAFVYDESADEWIAAFTSDADTSATITVSSYANFKALDVNAQGNLAVTSDATVGGDATVTGNVTGGNLVTAGTVDTADITASGSATVTGNVDGGNLVTTGDVTTATVTASGAITSDSLTAIGNVSGGNLTTAGDVTTATVTASGNVAGGNLTTTGDVTTATVTASGAITGSTTITATGNVTGGNLITAGATDTGSIDVTNNATVGGTLGVAGESTLASATVSDLTSGRVVLAGTAGAIEDNSNLTFDGSDLGVTGTVTASGNVTSGNIITAGAVEGDSLDIANDGLIGGTLTITGNLTVQGTTTTIDSTTTVVEDPIFTIGTSGLSADDGKDRGIEFAHHDGVSAFTGFFGYDDNEDLFTFIPDATNTNEVFTGTEGNVKFHDATLTGAVTVTETITGTGNITGGNLITAGDVEGANIDASSAITAGTTITATGNITGGNIISLGSFESNSLDSTTSITAGTTITATGNITGGNLITAGDVEGVNVDASGAVTATGNVSGGNLVTAGDVTTATVTASGNVSGGNLTTTGDVTTATVTASGAITGSTTITATGNVSGGNLVTAGAVEGASVDASGAIVGDTLEANTNATLASAAISDLTSGRVVLAGTSGELEDSGNFTFDGSTVAVTGAITASTTITATGNVTGGNLITAGDIEGADLSLSGDAVIGGDLTVNGNLAYVNVTTLAVEDPIVGVGRGADNAALSADDNKDRGSALYYYDGSEKSAFVGFDDSEGKMVLATDVTIAGEVVTVADYGNVLVGGIEGASATLTGNVTGGNLITAGAVEGASVDATGAITAGTTITATGNVTGGNIISLGSFESNSLDSTTSITAGTTITATGNITGGNLLTAGNIEGVNVDASGDVTATGNVSGGNLVTAGDIDAATGTIATLDGTTASFTGNVSGGNLVTAGAVDAGSVESSSTITATGNVTGGNLVTAGDVTTDTVTASGAISTGTTVTATGNVTGGNLVTGGDADVTGALTADTVEATTSATLASAQISDLTNDRVVLAGTSGELEDSADLTFDGSTLAIGGTADLTVAGGATVTGNVTGGNIVTAGDVSGDTLTITSDGTVGGTLTISGNLTVQGTTTTVESTTTTIEDPVFRLGVSSLTAEDGKDRGIEFLHFDGTAKTGFFGLDDTNNKFTFIPDATNTNEVFSGTVGDVVFGDADLVSLSTSGNASIGGDLDVTGGFTVTGNLQGGNVISDNAIEAGTTIDATGNITGGNIVTAGVVDAGSVESSTTVIATGNVNGGNLTTAGTITDGTLTISSGAIASATTVGASGNITGGNLVTAGATDTGSIDVTNNATVGGTATVTGNITGGNLVTAGDVTTATVTASGAISTDTTVTATGNVTGGNLTTAGAMDSATINTTGEATLASATVSDLTDNRVVIAGTSGALEDDANFTFDGSALALTGTAEITGDAGVSGDMIVGDVSGNITSGVSFEVAATDSLLLPAGTTAQRPGTPVAGMFRFNTSTNQQEIYNGVEWSAGTEFTIIDSETFDGDGSTVAFILGSEQTTDSCIVSINGVVQLPTTAYAVSGTTLTFTEAPISGDKVEVRKLTTTTTVVGMDNADGESVTLDASNEQIQFEAGGNANVVVIDGDGLTVTGTLSADSFSGLDATKINDGTSEMAVIATNGNIRGNVGGSTITLIHSSGVDVTGTVTATAFAGDITGDVTGNADTATALQTPRTIAGQSFDGSQNITIAATDLSDTNQSLATTDNVTFNNVTVSGTLNSDDITAATMTASGNVIVQGDLTVNGTTTTVNSTTLDVADKNITIADGAADAAAADGAGLTVDGASATFTYTNSGDKWNMNKDLDLGSNNFITSGEFQGTATSAQYADLAENYSADADYEPGTVVVFGGDAEVTVASEADDHRVAGVITTNPAYLMNSHIEADHIAGVAFTGRVPCKVTGTVSKGDLMVSAGNGMAKANNNPAPGTIIGKALENSEGDTVIEVVVGRF